ncbi:MAG: hypothetical protein HGB14_12145 [Anaerolineaceae bacterium]|nr:hypothetical protein [Anaerolineaceae bacterium]
MKIRKTSIFTVLILALVLSACVTANSDEAMVEKPTEAMVEKPTDSMMEETKASEMPIETPATDAMDKPADGEMMAAPDWFSTELTDVNTGSTFKINDFNNTEFNTVLITIISLGMNVFDFSGFTINLCDLTNQGDMMGIFYLTLASY